MTTQPHPTWLGDFFGRNTGLQLCEALTIAKVDKGLRAKEAELMRTKWFDYRRIHPLVATYYLAHCYNKAYGQFMRLAVDEGRVHMKGFKGADFMDTRERLSFWRLRQLCDQLGMRYEWFMTQAMNWCFKNGWRFPPRPQHITSNEDMVSDIVLAWEVEQRARIQQVKDPVFGTAGWRGTPAQLAWEDYLVEQIRKRQHREHALETYVYQLGLLRFERAVVEFGASILARSAGLILGRTNK